MKNITAKSDPADRSDKAKIELEKQLRSIWLGLWSDFRTIDTPLDALGVSRVEALLA